MWRSPGALLTESPPATIIRSAWRGLARNTSAPNREISQREALADIISMAQQARPKLTGQSDELRPQSSTLLTWVSRMLLPCGDSNPRGTRGACALDKFCTGRQGIRHLTGAFGCST